MKSSEYTEEIPRKHKIGVPRSFLGIYRRNSEETSVRRNIPRKFRGTMCSSEKTDEFRGNIIAVFSRRKLQYYDPFILASQADQVCYIKYPRVRNRDDPWVTVTRLNPRGRVQGSSELEDPLQPSTSGNLSAAEDLAGVGLVVDLTDFGEEAVVHVEDEPVIGEFHEDPDSDSSGDDDSETDYH
ncbi:hypothetical protein Bca101_075526 [Brassica carinata]